jgi:glycosyltransferase involved in cell wall biosynthesis
MTLPNNIETPKAPRVSVVVPNFNYEKFLGERLTSILDQTYRDFELIFLDDASPDGSVAYVRRVFGDRIDRIEVNQKNSGNPFVQWNRGVKLARGEFVWIAEADDYCSPLFLQRMLSAIEQSPRIGLAYCMTVPVDTESKILNANFHLEYLADIGADHWRHDFVANGQQEIHSYLSQKNTITNVSGVLFRRDAYLKSGPAFEKLRMCGDWLTYLQVLREWDVAFVSEPMNFHRQHPSKHTHNSVLNLSYFREFLHVQRYVVRAVSLSAHEKTLAFRRIIGEWDRLTVGHNGRITVPRTLRLAAMIAGTYHRPRQLAVNLKHLIQNATRSLRAK